MNTSMHMSIDISQLPCTSQHCILRLLYYRAVGSGVAGAAQALAHTLLPAARTWIIGNIQKEEAEWMTVGGDERCTYSEQWINVHIKAKISEASGNDFIAAIMSILPHLGYQYPRPPAILLLKLLISAHVYRYEYTRCDHRMWWYWNGVVTIHLDLECAVQLTGCTQRVLEQLQLLITWHDHFQMVYT